MITLTTTAETVKTISENTGRYGVRAPKGGCTVGDKVFKGGQFCFQYDPTDPHGIKAKPIVVEAPKPIIIPIYGFNYKVSELSIDPSIGSMAFILFKQATNNRYEIHVDTFGESHCTCPDHTMRRAGAGDYCKHIKELIAKGHLPAPAKPESEPQFDGPAMLAYASARNIIGIVSATGRMLGHGGFIKRWNAQQATEVYYRIAEVDAEVASGI